MDAKRMKRYLAEHGITQREVAQAVKMQPGSLSMVLNGKLGLSIERYEAICDYLGVPLDTFSTATICAAKNKD